MDSMDGEPSATDKLQQSYMNPFERVEVFAKKITENSTKDGKEVEIHGGQDPDKIGLIRRKWKIKFDKGVLENIQEGREKYDKWLKLHNNTSNKQVW